MGAAVEHDPGAILALTPRAAAVPERFDAGSGRVRGAQIPRLRRSGCRPEKGLVQTAMT